ncbi:MAG: hypothetical protein AAF674_00780 [Pseudomonadota bacterium]
MQIVRMITGFLAGAWGLMAAAAPAVAADLDVVIDRYDDSIEVYFTTRADRLVQTFALDPRHLTDAEGRVHFSELRSGTWDIGDALISEAPSSIDGTPITMEAMSLMVHPLDEALPMTTPFEAMTAVGVCTAEDPLTPPGLADLQGYVGFIAYVDDSHGALTIDLPQTGVGVTEVSIRDFVGGEPAGEYALTVSDGGAIVVPAAAQPPVVGLAWVLFGGFGALAASAMIWARRRQPPEALGT